MPIICGSPVRRASSGELAGLSRDVAQILQELTVESYEFFSDGSVIQADWNDSVSIVDTSLTDLFRR